MTHQNSLLFERLSSSSIPTIPAEDQERHRKAHQARINAQKSTGPTTPEGKLRASQNARRHGYAGAAMVIADEDVNAYNSHVNAYYRQFNPKTQAECDVVRRAANAVWRADRLASVETGIEDLERNHIASAVEVAYADFDPHHKAAYSFMSQTRTEGASAKSLCLRYLNAAHRDYDRAIRSFYLLKKNRLSPEEQLEAELAFPDPSIVESPQTAQPNPPEAAEIPEIHATPNEPTGSPRIFLVQPIQAASETPEAEKSAPEAPRDPSLTADAS